MAKADVFDSPRSLGQSRAALDGMYSYGTITRLQGTLLHVALQDQDAFRPPHVN